MRASLVAVVGLVILSAACGSPGSFSGKVSGQTLNVKSSAFASVSNLALSPNATNGTSASGLTIQGAAIILSSVKDVCADVTAKKRTHGQGYLLLGLGKAGVGNGSITTTTYNVIDPSDQTAVVSGALSGFGFASLDVEDGSCNNTLANDAGTAASGSINLNGLTSGKSGTADGSYQLSMGPQKDAVSGSFSADYCPGLEALIQAMLSSSTSTSTTSDGSSASASGSGTLDAQLPCS